MGLGKYKELKGYGYAVLSPVAVNQVKEELKDNQKSGLIVLRFKMFRHVGEAKIQLDLMTKKQEFDAVFGGDE